jgi:hypothetical protein
MSSSSPFIRRLLQSSASSNRRNSPILSRVDVSTLITYPPFFTYMFVLLSISLTLAESSRGIVIPTLSLYTEGLLSFSHSLLRFFRLEDFVLLIY